MHWFFSQPWWALTLETMAGFCVAFVLYAGYTEERMFRWADEQRIRRATTRLRAWSKEQADTFFGSHGPGGETP